MSGFVVSQLSGYFQKERYSFFTTEETLLYIIWRESLVTFITFVTLLGKFSEFVFPFCNCTSLSNVSVVLDLAMAMDR